MFLYSVWIRAKYFIYCRKTVEVVQERMRLAKKTQFQEEQFSLRCCGVCKSRCGVKSRIIYASDCRAKNFWSETFSSEKAVVVDVGRPPPLRPRHTTTTTTTATTMRGSFDDPVKKCLRVNELASTRLDTSWRSWLEGRKLWPSSLWSKILRQDGSHSAKPIWTKQLWSNIQLHYLGSTYVFSPMNVPS